MGSPDLLVKLPADASGPAAARAHTLAYLDEQGLSAFGAEVSLIVSELVTNAVVHGSPPVELCLARAGERLRVEVSDGSSDAGRVATHPQHSSVQARGLHIVERLSATWGTARSNTGKVVWAEYRLGNK